MGNIKKSLELISERNREQLLIANFFKEKGAIGMNITNSYDMQIVVCRWDRRDMKGYEICQMVDRLILECPKTKHFVIERSCNCAYVTHRDIYEKDGL